MTQFPLLLGHKLSFHSFLPLLPSLSSLSASLGVWRPVYSTENFGGSLGAVIPTASSQQICRHQRNATNRWASVGVAVREQGPGLSQFCLNRQLLRPRPPSSSRAEGTRAIRAGSASPAADCGLSSRPFPTPDFPAARPRGPQPGARPRRGFQPRLRPAPVLAPGSPADAAPPRPARRPRSSRPSAGPAAPRRALSLPSARCHVNSPVDSWAEAGRAFAKGEGGGRRARAPLPGGAAPAGGAVARSPPAKPLARRSHPTRGCSGGLRGLARGRASTGARADGCVPLGLRGSPPTPGWAPPVPKERPPFSLRCCCCCCIGGSRSHYPRGAGQKKGRERRAPRPAARPGRRPPPLSAAFRALAPLPSRPRICMSHDCGQSGLVSPEADGFCLRGKGVAGGACAGWPTRTEAFIAVVYFHPLPSCSLPLFLFFSALAGLCWRRGRKRDRVALISYVPGIWYQQD